MYTCTFLITFLAYLEATYISCYAFSEGLKFVVVKIEKKNTLKS